MKKKILSFALALTMCLGLLPGTAFADESNLPDWYFLIAIFKNVDADGIDNDGVKQHAKYSMTQDEVNVARESAKQFEEYMNQLGVMRTHVDIVEIEAVVTELEESKDGSYIGAKQAEPLLKSKVDLDKYDHVTCVASLDINTGYGGITGNVFENGTGHSCLNYVNKEYCLSRWAPGVYPWPPAYHVHEFLHFMELMNQKWDKEFGLHNIMEKFYERVNGEYEECYTDIILNCAKGTDGTGVFPAVWQYPPHMRRAMREWTVLPESTSIRDWTFQSCTALTRLAIPASVTSIGYAAFWGTNVTDIYYGGTEDQWKAIQIGEFNDPLTKANIHYNSVGIPATASPTNDKLTVDGAAANPRVYKIDGSNYFKIRDVATLLNDTEKQFAVGYDGEKNSVTATTGQGYDKQTGDLAGAATGGNQSADPSNDAIYVDGQKIEAEVYKINGSNYFKLRDLGKALNFYVGWSAERGMYIETDKPYSE